MPPNADSSADLMVDVRQLDFAYTDRLVLKHIDLQIPTGAATGLAGPNGGGKTTLLYLLLGLLRPSRGTIAVAGMSPLAAARNGRVFGYVPQSSQTNHRMPLSVRQVLALAEPQHPHKSHVNRLLELVGLIDLADTPIGELSGGQLQRMLIARALIPEPRLLVLDEPTTGIDITSRRQFIELILALRQERQLTLLIASHDLHVLQELCEDIACLNLTMHVHRRRMGEPMPPDEVICSFARTGRLKRTGRPRERGPG
jgi:zinc transport system ATP-binding protein